MYFDNAWREDLHKMSELYVTTCTGKDEAGTEYRYAYSILIGEMAVNGQFSCESYGVKVQEQGSGETAEIPNITTSISRIDGLMELLTRNVVTPCTLADVVSDWL